MSLPHPTVMPAIARAPARAHPAVAAGGAAELERRWRAGQPVADRTAGVMERDICNPAEGIRVELETRRFRPLHRTMMRTSLSYFPPSKTQKSCAVLSSTGLRETVTAACNGDGQNEISGPAARNSPAGSPVGIGDRSRKDTHSAASRMRGVFGGEHGEEISRQTSGGCRLRSRLA